MTIPEDQDHHEDGVHIVVSEHELEDRTRTGWRLVQTIQVSVPVSYVSHPYEQGTAATNWMPTMEKRAEQIGIVTKFVVARTRDSEMSFLRERIEELTADLSVAMGSIDGLRRSEAAARSAESQLTDRYGRDMTSMRSEVDAYLAAGTKLSADRAKAEDDLNRANKNLRLLTKAFGELQVQKVLGDSYTEVK